MCDCSQWRQSLDLLTFTQIVGPEPCRHGQHWPAPRLSVSLVVAAAQPSLSPWIDCLNWTTSLAKLPLSTSRGKSLKKMTTKNSWIFVLLLSLRSFSFFSSPLSQSASSSFSIQGCKRLPNRKTKEAEKTQTHALREKARTRTRTRKGFNTQG